ncbi:type I-E CRISPR-associated protein Cse1/CasA [Acidaminococcus timonensis]|uniref:type I-E CRISPR-associated protein Cse1/CasA n=1 Tax=Acidaminococcus timonensis TaxID=1871002 RepID=UPI0026F16E2D|nr:type I-E CRISPR-associated protein Cse1/CasA [Acidaminococcus timonensis]
MEEREFNLLDEPWIKVLRPDLQVDTLSLQDVMLRAQDYMDLGGENVLQNFAMLRLLIAVAYTIFSRVDENGEKNDLAEIDDLVEAKDEAINRWEALWDNKKFPEQPMLDYFKEHHDEFWLFDPERPFGQVPEAKRGTEYEAGKLIGDISESSNKIRLFANRSGLKKREVSYGEAARWLLFVNAFDDTSAKPKQKGLPSPGAGWVGKLGMIQGVGQNLFETILLNCTFLKDGEKKWSEEACPNWEHLPKPDERTEIPVPDNLAGLLTLQSRRLLLKREQGHEERVPGHVIGYYLLGGDFFSNNGEDGAFNEQMTVWNQPKDLKKNFFHPQRNTLGKQMWRDFGNYFIADEKENINRHLPGVVRWIRTLDNEVLNGDEPVHFKTIALQYGDKDFFINDFSSDTLTIYSSLLNEKEYTIQNEINHQIEKCQQAANAVNWLLNDLEIAGGGDTEKKTNKGAEIFYQKIDEPFRTWLLRFHGPVLKDPDGVRKLYDEWERTARNIALEIAYQAEKNASTQAYQGRITGPEDHKQFYSLPKADFLFRGNLFKIYPKVGEEK